MARNVVARPRSEVGGHERRERAGEGSETEPCERGRRRVHRRERRRPRLTAEKASGPSVLDCKLRHSLAYPRVRGAFMRTVLVIATALGLSGCAEETSNSELSARLQSEMEACANLRTAVARAKCEIAVNHQVIARGSGANMDLIELEDANRIALAAKVDAGQMSEADANLRFSQIKSQLISEAKRRNNDASTAAAASMAAMPLPSTCHTYDNGAGLTTNCY
jgi:hypothetical protein